MSSFALKIVVGLTRGWTRFYTQGLPTNKCEDRRQEIESDLWEQINNSRFEKESSAKTFVLILLRLLFGAGDDLLWRYEQFKEQGQRFPERNRVMKLAKLPVRPRSYINLVAVLAGMLILFPIGVGAFVAAVVSVAVPLGLISAPITYKMSDLNIGPFVVDSMPEAIVTSLVGFVLLMVLLYVANGIVGILGCYVSVEIGQFRLGNRRS